MAEEPVDQSYEIINAAKADPNKYNEEETIMYNFETRMRLINDLEELDAFLRQRQVELSSKDHATYAVYSTATTNLSSELKDCDSTAFCKLACETLADITGVLNHKDTLYLLLLRSKPRQAAQRVVQIGTLEKKDREIGKEVVEVKKQIEEGEKRVRELTQIIQTELSAKIKGATVKVAL